MYHYIVIIKPNTTIFAVRDYSVKQMNRKSIVPEEFVIDILHGWTWILNSSLAGQFENISHNDKVVFICYGLTGYKITITC